MKKKYQPQHLMAKNPMTKIWHLTTVVWAFFLAVVFLTQSGASLVAADNETGKAATEVIKIIEQTAPQPFTKPTTAKVLRVEEAVSIGEVDPKAEEQLEELEAALSEAIEKAEAEHPEKDRAYYEAIFTEEIRNMLAVCIYGEANWYWITWAQKSMVVWAILNRLDSGEGWFSDNYYDLYHVITKEGQIDGYKPERFPVTEEYRELVDDVIDRYIREKLGETNVGRTLAQDVCFWHGDGHDNIFYKYEGSGSWLYGNVVEVGSTPLCDPYA